MTTLVSIRNVSKRFVLSYEKSLRERVVALFKGKRKKIEFLALDSVSVDIELGTTVGLIGHNGSGKSTLLKLIGGILDPSTGSIARRGRLAALLELGAGFHPDLTGRENIFLNASVLGMSREETERQFEAIVEFSGIPEFIDTQVKFYSSGMYVRLAFAVAIHSDPDLLLVDEVLAVGDEPFQLKCMRKIEEFQREGRTIILVSHSAEQVRKTCDRVIVLNHGRVQFDGEPEQGLRRLREIYLTDSSAAGRISSETATIQSIDLLSAADSDAEPELALGEAFSIDFVYQLNEPVEKDLKLAIAIDTVSGIRCITIDSEIYGVPIPGSEGTHRVEIQIAEGHGLGSGEFILHGLLQDQEGRTVAGLNPGGRFLISATNQPDSFIRAEISVLVDPDPPFVDR